MSTDTLFAAQYRDSQAEYHNQMWLCSLLPLLEGETTPESAAVALKKAASVAPSEDMKRRAEEAEYLLGESVVAMKSFLATIVPAQSRRELTPPLHGYASLPEMAHFRKDDAPYLYRTVPCPQMPTTIAAIPVVDTASKDAPIAQSSAAPAPGPSADVVTSSGTQPYGQMGNPLLPMQDGWSMSYGASMPSFQDSMQQQAMAQMHSFSGQVPPSFPMQNKYNTGHGVYGYSGTNMFPSYGGMADMYPQQQQYGMNPGYDFGGGPGMGNFNRQQQMFPMQYRQDPSSFHLSQNAMPTASLQSYPAAPPYSNYPSMDRYNMQGMPGYSQLQQGGLPGSGGPSDHSRMGYGYGGSMGGPGMPPGMDPSSGGQNAFGYGHMGQQSFGHMGMGGPPHMPMDNTSFRNTQGWQPSAMPGSSLSHRDKPQALSVAPLPPMAMGPGGRSGLGAHDAATLGHLPPPAAIPPTRKPTNQRQGVPMSSDDKRPPLRYRVVGAEGGPAPHAPGRVPGAALSGLLKAAQQHDVSGDHPARPGVTEEEFESEDEWPLSMFALALHRQEKRDHGRVLDETVEQNGKGLVRNKQFLQLPVSGAAAVIEANYHGPSAVPDDESAPISKQILAVKRLPDVAPSKDNFGMDVGQWLTPLSHSRPEFAAADAPVTFVWPDDNGDDDTAPSLKRNFLDGSRSRVIPPWPSVPRVPFATPFPRTGAASKKVVSLTVSKRLGASEAPLPEHLSRSPAPAPVWSYMFGSVTQRPEPYKRSKFDALSPSNDQVVSMAGNWMGFRLKEPPTFLAPPPTVPPRPMLDPENTTVLSSIEGDDAPLSSTLVEDEESVGAIGRTYEAVVIRCDNRDNLDAESHTDMKRFAISMARIAQRSARERAQRYNILFDPFCRVGLPPLQDRPEFEANISAALDLDLYRRVEVAVASEDMDVDNADRLQNMASRAVRARSFVLVNHAKRQLMGVTDSLQHLDAEVVQSIPAYPAPVTTRMLAQPGYLRSRDLYRCSACDRTFRTARGMRVHKFHHHSGQSAMARARAAPASQLDPKMMKMSRKRRKRFGTGPPTAKKVTVVHGPAASVPVALHEDVAAGAVDEVWDEGVEDVTVVPAFEEVGHGDELWDPVPDEPLFPRFQRSRTHGSWKCVDLPPRKNPQKRQYVELSGMLVYEHYTLRSALAESPSDTALPSPVADASPAPSPKPVTDKPSDSKLVRFGYEIVGATVEVYQRNLTGEPIFKTATVMSYVARRQMHRFRYADGTVESRTLNTDNTRLPVEALGTVVLPMDDGTSCQGVSVEAKAAAVMTSPPVEAPIVVSVPPVIFPPPPPALPDDDTSMDALLALTRLLQKKSNAPKPVDAPAPEAPKQPVTAAPAPSSSSAPSTAPSTAPSVTSVESLHNKSGSQGSGEPGADRPRPVVSPGLTLRIITARQPGSDSTKPRVVQVPTEPTTKEVVPAVAVPPPQSPPRVTVSVSPPSSVEPMAPTAEPSAVAVVPLTKAAPPSQPLVGPKSFPSQFSLDAIPADEMSKKKVPLKCTTCNIGFSNVGAFKSHRAKCTHLMAEYNASVAEAVAKQNDPVGAGVETGVQIACRYCNRMFDGEIRVATHEPHCPVWKLCATTSTTETRECMYCGDPFVGFSKLSVHLKTCSVRLRRAYGPDVVLPTPEATAEREDADTASSSSEGTSDSEDGGDAPRPSKGKPFSDPAAGGGFVSPRLRAAARAASASTPASPPSRPVASPPASAAKPTPAPKTPEPTPSEKPAKEKSKDKKREVEESSSSPGSIGDQLYIVDCILGRKKDSKGKYHYLVRWQGYTDKDNSWVARDNFVDKRLAKEYDERVAAKKRRKMQ